jgi:hypothetical protein
MSRWRAALTQVAISFFVVPTWELFNHRFPQPIVLFASLSIKTNAHDRKFSQPVVEHYQPVKRNWNC